MYKRSQDPSEEPNPWRTVAQALETALMSPGLAACTCPDRPKPGARCPHCQIREAEDALAKIN